MACCRLLYAHCIIRDDLSDWTPASTRYLILPTTASESRQEIRIVSDKQFRRSADNKECIDPKNNPLANERCLHKYHPMWARLIGCLFQKGGKWRVHKSGCAWRCCCRVLSVLGRERLDLDAVLENKETRPLIDLVGHLLPIMHSF